MTAPSVIITGVSGFLGSHTAAHFKARGYVVCGIDVNVSNATNCDHIVEGKITTATLQQAAEHCSSRPIALIHAAGSGSVKSTEDDPSTDFQFSVASVADSLAFLKKEAPQTKFVFPSSAAVYGHTGDVATKEGAPLSPISLYGVYKNACETMIHGFSTVSGIPTVIIRFFSLYGPGLRKQLVWDVCEKAATPPHIIKLDGDGSDRRDFLHVQDAADLIAHAVETHSESALILNGGSGQSHSVKEVGQKIAKLYGCGEPEFSAVDRPWDPSNFLADMSRARQKLSFEPKISFESGLADVVAWHKQEKAS